jgi:hypothetical protein
LDAQTDEDRSHPAIVSDLLDLQARLRGEPATVVRPKMGRPGDGSALDALGLLSGGSDHTVSRIEALRRRLASLELEIEAYEAAVVVTRPAPAPAGVVLPFRRVDEVASPE